MIENTVVFNTDQRLTRSQKEANNKRWFKDQVDSLDSMAFSNSFFDDFGDNSIVSEHRRMQTNYDLFNNKVNKTDFEYVCKPFGDGIGELPAEFTNKDILSGKVKALIGMEMKRPFSWKIVATNEEATTRREQEEFGMLREYVINSIMAPIRQELEMQAQQEAKGRELSQEEQQQIQQQIEEELKTRTPDEVKKYMEREHQDPAELLSHQILEYLIQKQDIKTKFNIGWKHGLIAGKEIFWAGEVNGEPVLRNINPIRFDCDISNETSYIEDGEWACYHMYMLPSEIVSTFGSELSNKDIDYIYSNYNKGNTLLDTNFDFSNYGLLNKSGIRVLHCEWKGLKPIKFLTTQDLETGEIIEDIVDESYKLNPEVGDISVRTEWIPTKYEGYKIGQDIYVYLREVPGQNRDLDNLYNCKLSYIGAYYDNTNSKPTSLIDRMKYYQYVYNIIWYKIELLISSDDGKSLLLNANQIPKSAGLDIEKWMYFFKVNKIGLLDPTEEGSKNGDVTQAAKEIDLSLASDIQKYIQLLEYIEKRCGESVGITKQVEGQISNDEAVRNTQQALVQSANILEPYFDVHNNIKKNVLQALIETAKATYANYQPRYLSYVLDDMSRKMVSMDYDLLDNSTYAVFVSNSVKTAEALDTVKQLSHAAMQNQMIELSDVLTIMNSNSAKEAEEMLKAAEKERIEREQAAQQQQIQATQEEAKAQREWQERILQLEHNNKMEEIKLKGEFELQKQAMLSIGFNEDKDLDRDGKPDVLEVYKAGVDAEIKQRKQALDEEKFKENKKQHKDKMELESKKIQAQVAKAKVSQ